MMLARTFVLTAVLLVATSCAPGVSRSSAQVSPQPTHMPLVNSTPTAPLPTPGPVPPNCPISNPVRHTLPGLAPVIGASPVWMTWPMGLGTFHLAPSAPYEAPYGWQITKVIWEVGPHYTQVVKVRGHDHVDGTPLMVEFNDQPLADAVLDPQHPDHPSSVVGLDWLEWGSYIVVPKAGCYTMEVSWPAGQWQVTFAVGA